MSHEACREAGLHQARHTNPKRLHRALQSNLSLRRAGYVCVWQPRRGAAHQHPMDVSLQLRSAPSITGRHDTLGLPETVSAFTISTSEWHSLRGLYNLTAPIDAAGPRTTALAVLAQVTQQFSAQRTARQHIQIRVQGFMRQAHTPIPRKHQRQASRNLPGRPAPPQASKYPASQTHVLIELAPATTPPSAGSLALRARRPIVPYRYPIAPHLTTQRRGRTIQLPRNLPVTPPPLQTQTHLLPLQQRQSRVPCHATPPVSPS